jgi:pimeloyl-ACP methyl ester carboxylesterase
LFSDNNKNKSIFMKTNKISYKTIHIDSQTVFYRESGNVNAPTILLLHGFPSSSHMFRNLIPILSENYHVVAPDLIGFGLSSHLNHKEFDYTFDNLAHYVDLFTQKLNLDKYAIYVFDYGAPVGYRLALANPEKITGIISQNGNAYEEGLSEAGWNPVRKYWADRTPENREALRSFMSAEATKWQYIHGVNDETLVSPDGYISDQYFLDRENNNDIQLDLFGNYSTNVALYPKFQEYFRTYQPPFLAVWGKNDPFFLPEGAESYKRDIPNAIVKFYDTGHFALETHVEEIGEEIVKFLASATK